MRQVGQAWEVDLPPGVQAHRVINPEHLRKAAADPLPGQHNAPPPAENVIGEDEWEVESIQDSSLRYRNNGLWYQVKWVGYEDPDNSWHKASDLKYAPDKIIRYHRDHPDKPGPPQHLLAWKARFDAGEDDYEDLDTNLQMDESSRTRFFEGGE